MELNDYLEPVEINSDFFSNYTNLTSRYFHIDKNTIKNQVSDLSKYQIAIVGICYEHGSENSGCAKAPEAIRKQFYSLYNNNPKVQIIDLGNVKTGKSPNDALFAMADLLNELAKHNIVTIIIGGAKNLIFGTYLTYKHRRQGLNMISVEPRIELSSSNFKTTEQTYLQKIISNKSDYFYNFCNLGFQSYYVQKDELDLMDSMNFDYYRLGTIRNDITLAEPIIRDADCIHFDLASIKQSDAPANSNPSINGFTSDEACRLARYAGISDKIKSFGIFELNPEFDLNSQTANLAAQMIWYFIEGFSQRKNDFPDLSENYTKFIVHVESLSDEIIFHKSLKTERWWMEIPSKKIKSEEAFIVSCSYDDYLKTCNQEIPDKWWKFYKKLN